jgi:hypothetical protein
MRTIALVLVAVATVAGAAVQRKPDVSGVWTLDMRLEPAAASARELTVHQETQRMMSVRGGPVERTSITIQRHDANGVHSETYEIGTIGGTVDGDGSRTSHSVKWVGQTLVIETGSYSGPPGNPGTFAERREEWSLAGRDRLVINAEDRSSDRTAITTTSKYLRR